MGTGSERCRNMSLVKATLSKKLEMSAGELFNGWMDLHHHQHLGAPQENSDLHGKNSSKFHEALGVRPN